MRKVILMILIYAIFHVYFLNFLQVYKKTISFFAFIFNKSQIINYILNVFDIALHNSDGTEENETIQSFLIPILTILLLIIGYIINKKKTH